MSEKSTNQNLTTNSFGNRVHSVKKEPVEVQSLTNNEGGYINPRNRVNLIHLISHRTDFRKRMKSAEELDKIRG
jgi:hypothetical protein